MIISRRNTLILGAAATAASFAGLPSARADDDVTIDPAKLMAPAGLPDHVLGNKDSKVTMIEYGSATCPHCGRFHHDVYPLLKQKYIDTNKIAFIFRPFALNVFDVVVFMLAEIAGPDHYYNVIDTFYDNQDKWVQSDKPKDAIEAIALQLGFTDDSFNQALTNQDLPKAIQAQRDQAVNDFKVSGTPTFYINGKQMVGEQTIDDLSKTIDPLLA
ncbi:MAG TPA: thioredoxin domain-containing protein [Devosia sp.]|nr:thioredoxin domain-containing protein [Devosia sp.]